MESAGPFGGSISFIATRSPMTMQELIGSLVAAAALVLVAMAIVVLL